MKKIIPLITAAIIALSSSLLHSKPVPEEDRIPVDVRRTTLLVNDMDLSLELYKDALGLNVIYDQTLVNDDPSRPGKKKRRRLVLLQANDDFIGYWVYYSI